MVRVIRDDATLRNEYNARSLPANGGTRTPVTPLPWKNTRRIIGPQQLRRRRRTRPWLSCGSVCVRIDAVRIPLPRRVLPLPTAERLTVSARDRRQTLYYFIFFQFSWPSARCPSTVIPCNHSSSCSVPCRRCTWNVVGAKSGERTTTRARGAPRPAVFGITFFFSRALPCTLVQRVSVIEAVSFYAIVFRIDIPGAFCRWLSSTSNNNIGDGVISDTVPYHSWYALRRASAG